jgi:hypothetical protein
MLRDLEIRLATVLGADLPAPLTGRVTVAPATVTGNGASVQIATGAVAKLSPDFGSVRQEIAPGDAQSRRILRLSAEIGLAVSVGPAGSRTDRAAAVDQLLYFLDNPTFVSGAALRDAGDPGFLLERIEISRAHLAPDREPVPPLDVVLTATGWFWPVGLAGQDGPAIAEARIRQLVFPAGVTPEPARFAAGSGDVELRLAFTDEQALSLRTDAQPATVDPAELAFRLRAADGSAGAGSFTDGRDLGGGDRARPLSGGVATIRYQPPASSATDILTVSSIIDDAGADRFGPEVLRVVLETEAGP